MAESFLTIHGLAVALIPLKKRFGDKWRVFLERMIIKVPQPIGAAKVITLYEISNQDGKRWIILPRTYLVGLAKMIKPTIRWTTPVLPAQTMTPSPQLHSGQKIVVNRIMEILTPERRLVGTAAAVLNLKAGMGKTFVAAEVIKRIGQRTLFVVPKVPLLKQAIDDLTVCKISAKPLIAGDAWVTVIVINSALLQPPEFYKQFGLVIFDEIHAYCSPKRRAIFRMCSAPFVLGMSATTEDRTDQSDIIFHKEFAFDGIIRAESLPGFSYDDVIFDTAVRIIRYCGPPKYTKTLYHESTGRMFCSYMYKQLLRDPYRQQLALRVIGELYNDPRNTIFVFCEEREPLVELSKLLTVIGSVAAPEVGMFVGGIGNETIGEIKNTARIILTTYGYSGTGVSINRANCMVFLTPRKSQMKQILARAMRRGGDVDLPRIYIDIVDWRTPFRRQLTDRQIAYQFYGMKTIAEKIDWSDLAADCKGMNKDSSTDPSPFNKNTMGKPLVPPI